MKVTLKLVLVVLVVTVVVMSLAGYLRVQREVETFQTDIARDLHMLGQILKPMLADALGTYGRQHVLQLITDANKNHDRVQFTWIELRPSTAIPDRPWLHPQQVTTLQNGTTLSMQARASHGQPTLYVYIPITVDSMTSVLEVSESLAVVDDYIRHTVLRTVKLGMVLVLLSGCLLLLIGMVMIGKPMRRVIEKTRRVGVGDLEGPLYFSQHDEFAEVAAALNQMCEQLKASQAAVHAEMESRLATLEQLRHADRLKTVGGLASGIAHELGTPLNVISGRASLIASGQLTPPDIADSTRIITEQVQRITTIIRQLLDFARRKSPQRLAVDLRTLAQHTLDMLIPLATQQHSVLTLKTDDVPLQARIDAGQIQQVLMNLVTNAWQAMPTGGQITIGVHRTTIEPPVGLDLPRGYYACLSVTDQGEGIAAEDLHHIFDPFFTTKDVGRGTGLGLSLAYGIVRDHGGWIDVTSRPGAGACFTVHIPMEEEPCLDTS